MIPRSKIIKWLPPAILEIWRKNKDHGWKGGYKTWEQAVESSLGYDQDEIFEVVYQSILAVQRGGGAFAQDGMVFDKIEYNFPLLSALQWVAARNNNTLRMLDYGGDLGSVYLRYRQILESISVIEWEIIEQEHFVKLGKEHFETENLRFHRTLSDSQILAPNGCALFAGVLQYLQQPYELIDRIVSMNFKHVIIDRTPVSSLAKDLISVQKTHPGHPYTASYPCHIFGKDNLLNRLAQKYDLIFEYNNYDHAEPLKQTDFSFHFRGYLFERKPSIQ